jgi:ankyrin repeat protein
VDVQPELGPFEVTPKEQWFTVGEQQQLSVREDLHQIAARGDAAAVRRSLESGADVNATNYEGRTALQLAAEAGHKEVVDILLAGGAEKDAFIAAFLGDLAFIEGALKDDPGFAEKGDASNQTLLHWAARGGHVETAELLLDRGADANAVDDEEHTPLIMAAMNGHRQTAEVLLAHGAEIDTRDVWGATAMYRAAMNGHAEVVEFLLEKGADVEAEVPGYGRTALQRAALNGHKQVVALLLAHGANVNAQDYGGNGPLSNAARGGHDEVVQLLRENGAEG